MKTQLTEAERLRLDELAVLMRTASGKELDRIATEVSLIIGHEDLCDLDPEQEAEAQRAMRTADFE